MRQKAFTLIELLVVIAIIAILAAILFPVFAQAKEAAKKASDLSNVKQQATAMMMYLEGHDDQFPLGYGADATGTWQYTAYHYVPQDWPSGPGTDASYTLRLAISPYSWANSTQPYVKNFDMLQSPGTPQTSGGNVSNAAVGKTPADVSYTYNGLLMSYSHTAVTAPAQLPVLWNGRGKAKIKGGALSNPTLICATANQGCVYIPRNTSTASCATGNGGTSAMFTLAGTMWVYAKGANFALADGHAKWRRMGAQISPQNTDYRNDPYTGYNSAGFPASFWYDLCHAWLFRPDYDFSL